MTSRGLAALTRRGFGSTTVTEAWAVRAGRAAPPGPAVLVKDAVLVRTVPWVLPARVDMRAVMVTWSRWGLDVAFW